MKNLTLLRKQNGLSQNKLGLEVGLASNTICQYESGRRIPDVSTLILLADYFGVSTDYLLDRQERTLPPLSEAKQQLIDEISTLSDEQLDFVLFIVKKSKELNKL